MFVPHRKHLRASRTFHGDSFVFLYVADVRTSQETPMDLHGLLTGIAFAILLQRRSSNANFACSFSTKQTKQTPWPLVRERTIPTERPHINLLLYGEFRLSARNLSCHDAAVGSGGKASQVYLEVAWLESVPEYSITFCFPRSVARQVVSYHKQNKLRGPYSASELYRLSDRHLSTKFSANFCG
jgi:hypothetical protein